MLKLKDVYALPTTPVALVERVMGEKWLPEVRDMEYHVPHEVLTAMDQEGLISIRQVGYRDFDCERSAGLYTLWFKGQPVGIIGQAGRGGDEDVERHITDTDAFAALCQYVRTKLASEAERKDFHDPEKFVYPEQVFSVGGFYFGEDFGHPAAAKAKGIILYVTPLIPKVGHEMYLVTAEPQYSPMPEYVRVNEHVFQLVREVNPDEHALNTRLRQVSEAEGHTQFYWYNPCERPEDAEVLAI